MRIFVGITSYNTREYLENCLRTLVARSRPARVHVVDNGSTDGTVGMLAGWPDAAVTHEVCERNSLAAGGARKSVDRFLAEGDCGAFLHLDADTETRGDALGSLALQMGGRQDVAVGVRVGKLRYGHPKSRSLRTFDDYMFGEWRRQHAPGLGDKDFRERMLARAADGTLVYRELCGWFLAFPRTLIDRIGNVDDTRYGMWRWESEWVLRASARGCAIEHAAAVRDGLVHHFGGRSRRRAKNPGRYGSTVKRDLGK